MPTDICAVFVCNRNYFDKFLSTCAKLITIGNFNKDICLVISNDILLSADIDIYNHTFIKQHKIIIKIFDNIQIPEQKYKSASFRNKVEGCSLKFNLFRSYFKQWSYIFYIDCGIKIFSKVDPIIDSRKANKLLAHSDAYPTYKWKLHVQFDKKTNEFQQLKKKFNLEVDYFQSTIMLFDTNIIENNTFDNLITLLKEYPIGRTNDQCYLSLYFILIHPCWEQIPLQNDNTCFYDYLKRNKSQKYIMLKR